MKKIIIIMNVLGIKLRRYYFKSGPQKILALATQSVAQDRQFTCFPWKFAGNAEFGSH